MDDEQKERLKQNLINLMEAVGSAKPTPLSKAFRTKLYFRKFLRWLASPLTYFTHKRKLKRIRAEMELAAQEVVNAQIETMRKGLELLESLSAYKPNPPWLPWQQPYKGYNPLRATNYQSRKFQHRPMRHRL